MSDPQKLRDLADWFDLPITQARHPNWTSSTQVQHDLRIFADEIKRLRADAARLDWLEEHTRRGGCPGIIFDDDGHWAVSGDGMQNVRVDNEGPLHTTFFIEEGAFRDTIREAIDAFRAEIEEVDDGK